MISELYQLLKEYAENTQDDYFNLDKIEVLDILEMDRAGEGERYAPFSNLENRHLLWYVCVSVLKLVMVVDSSSPGTDRVWPTGSEFSHRFVRLFACGCEVRLKTHNTRLFRGCALLLQRRQKPVIGLERGPTSLTRL
jgi:Poly(ADP-ribose) polymerase catalytic domain